MKRLLHVALVSCALTACFDWEGEYQKVLVRLDGGSGGSAGGGSATGGGTASGGGVGGGSAGGSAGGGSTAGGMGGGGQSVDAGCQQLLCPVDVYESTRSTEANDYVTGAPGLVAEAPERYTAYVSFRTGANRLHLQLLRTADGGVTEINRTADFYTDNEAHFGSGVSLRDFWFVQGPTANHYVDNVLRSSEQACVTPDGGADQIIWWGVATPRADHVWLVGRDYTTDGFGICRWSPDAGAVMAIEPNADHPLGYAFDVFETPSGAVFAAGGDYIDSSTGSTSYIYVADGGVASTPAETDPDGWGFVGIAGAGEKVWAVSRTGRVVERSTGDNFSTVYTASSSLRDIEVRTANDIWAVGRAGHLAVHFDGGSWGTVELPSSAAAPDIVWQRVVAVPEGLVLSGYRQAGTDDYRIVIHSYRTFGH